MVRKCSVYDCKNVQDTTNGIYIRNQLTAAEAEAAASSSSSSSSSAVAALGLVSFLLSV